MTETCEITERELLCRRFFEKTFVQNLEDFFLNDYSGDRIDRFLHCVTFLPPHYKNLYSREDSYEQKLSLKSYIITFLTIRIFVFLSPSFRHLSMPNFTSNLPRQKK